MFWRYDKEQLLSFRPAAPDTIRRSVRKILFRLHIWRPRRRRFRAIGTSPTPVLNSSSARSGSHANCSPTSQPRTQPCLQNSDHMTVASLNARSIRHKSTSIQDIIKQHNVDIFTIVEAWHEQENDLSVRDKQMKDTVALTPHGHQAVVNLPVSMVVVSLSSTKIRSLLNAFNRILLRVRSNLF